MPILKAPPTSEPDDRRYKVRENRKMLHLFKNLSGAIFYSIALIISINPDLFGGVTGATLIVCGAQSARFAVSKKQSGLRTVLMIAGVFLFILPSMALASFRDINVIQYLIAYFVISDAFQYIAEKMEPRRSFRYRRNKSNDKWRNKAILFVLLLWCSFSGIVITNAGELTGLLTFTAPFAISLIYFERLVSGGGVRSGIYVLLAFYFLTILLYILFQWSGFGRLLIGSFLLMPFLIAHRYHDLGFRGWQIILVAPPLLYLAQVSRYGTVGSLERLFTGSAGHHLVVTKDAAELAFRTKTLDWHGFWDQILLTYLNWMPRDFWPEKPIGAGWLSVGDMYGREGYNDDYSQSLGFIGEQLYLVGPYAFFTLAFVLILLLFTRKIIQIASLNYWAPVAIFDVGLISYIWGGGALFGSRIWFFLIPCLALILMQRFFTGLVKGEANLSPRSAS